ncbi:MAG: hypothetical protein RR235_08240 [Oscillospiraceae bacterium]
MALYKKCPKCGSRLDPGESCDCGNELKRGNEQNAEPRHGERPPKSDEGDFDLKAYREAKGIKQQEIVDLVATRYPKFKKPVASSCENANYGTTLRRGATQLILNTFGEICDNDSAAKKAPRIERRRLGGKFTFRIEKERTGRLELHYRADGFDTFQAFAYFWLSSYLKVKDKELAPPPAVLLWLSNLMDDYKKNRPQGTASKSTQKG